MLSFMLLRPLVKLISYNFIRFFWIPAFDRVAGFIIGVIRI